MWDFKFLFKMLNVLIEVLNQKVPVNSLKTLLLTLQTFLEEPMTAHEWLLLFPDTSNV